MRGAIGMAGDNADDIDEAEGDDDDDDDDEAKGGGSDDEWPGDGSGDDESATAGLGAAVTVGGRGAAAAAGFDPVAAVTAGVGPSVVESGSKTRPVEVVLAEMVYKADVDLLPASQGLTPKGKRRAQPKAEVEVAFDKLKIAVETAAGEKTDRKEMVADIVAELKLVKEKAAKKEAKKVAAAKMNLHRMNQLFFFYLLRWDGEAWGEGNVRSEIVELSKMKWMIEREKKKSERENESENESESDKDEPSEDKVLKWARKDSPLFLGLRRLLDVELRLAVGPFILWEQGDFRHFLNALPAMCAIIASSHKPMTPSPKAWGRSRRTGRKVS